MTSPRGFEESPAVDGLGSNDANGGLRARRSTAVMAAYRRHRFGALFVSLLLTLAAGSTLDALAPRHDALQLLLALNLLAAIASVAREVGMRVPIVLGLAYLGARGLLATLDVPSMLAVSEGIWVTAVGLAMVVAIRHAFVGGVVDRERIFAALDAYLLAGLLFGVAYEMVDRLNPGSFGGVATGGLDLPDAIYFSFVTIASLGYGDVLPVSPPARGLATVEAVSGQMYMAVLVARLVGLYSRGRDR